MGSSGRGYAFPWMPAFRKTCDQRRGGAESVSKMLTPRSFRDRDSRRKLRLAFFGAGRVMRAFMGAILRDVHPGGPRGARPSLCMRRTRAASAYARATCTACPQQPHASVAMQEARFGEEKVRLATLRTKKAPGGRAALA